MIRTCGKLLVTRDIYQGTTLEAAEKTLTIAMRKNFTIAMKKNLFTRASA